MGPIHLDGAIIIMMARRRWGNQAGAAMALQEKALIRTVAIGSLIAFGGAVIKTRSGL
jgi:hypothetical protein